ncbi:hypothetical protein CYMTET_19502 [Cymbomonas tetramitiformis]|uniref:Uncharacterized protein n=1 Tax=Cymbomonas tetramitiformis TaxID=36881 RepID=A0AAE0L4W9_9CHLO|nr:hypothetical protein CYMTET_19502 [Cymbomonas tetramitiformis]
MMRLNSRGSRHGGSISEPPPAPALRVVDSSTVPATATAVISTNAVEMLSPVFSIAAALEAAAPTRECSSLEVAGEVPAETTPAEHPSPAIARKVAAGRFRRGFPVRAAFSYPQRTEVRISICASVLSPTSRFFLCCVQHRI